MDTWSERRLLRVLVWWGMRVVAGSLMLTKNQTESASSSEGVDRLKR
jgi:hypothetical protein